MWPGLSRVSFDVTVMIHYNMNILYIFLFISLYSQFVQFGH